KAGEDGEVVLKHETEGDVEVSLAVPKEGSHGDFSADVRLAAAGPVLLVDGASGAFKEKPNFRDALAALKGEGKEPLATAPAFKSSLAGRGGGVKVWFDTGKLIRADLAAGDPSMTTAKMFGADEFGPLSARLQLDAKELHLEVLQSWTEKCAGAKLL